MNNEIKEFENFFDMLNINDVTVEAVSEGHWEIYYDKDGLNYAVDRERYPTKEQAIEYAKINMAKSIHNKYMDALISMAFQCPICIENNLQSIVVSGFTDDEFRCSNNHDLLRYKSTRNMGFWNKIEDL